jgi:hypothetical protein
LDLKITSSSRDLIRKQPYLLQPSVWDGQKLVAGGGLRGFDGLRIRLRGAGGRGERGDRDGVLTSVGDGREQPNFGEEQTMEMVAGGLLDPINSNWAARTSIRWHKR